jgi:multidrug efflux pump subunit AcrB
MVPADAQAPVADEQIAAPGGQPSKAELAADLRQRPLTEILLEAGAIRFKPILLTALAAMIGAAVILTDPIFQGLAISLLFGLASSTLLTVLVIPAIYRVLRT